MSEKQLRIYCPSCGEIVDAFVMIAGGMERPHCSQCGLVLQDVKRDEETVALDTVIIAEDSQILRNLICDTLKTRKIAKSVLPCENGKEFLSVITSILKSGKNIDLSILDVNMPVIDGINAAKTLRAMEDGFKKSGKIPILFFSVVKCDERFKKILDILKPAAFLNKGKENEPQELANRVSMVIKRLISG